MKVLFAPDYRAGNCYQQLLAEGLQELGVEVVFLSHWRRLLPLYRGVGGFDVDAVHLHWPENYFPKRGELLDFIRVWRYRFDFMLARRRVPFFLTAHNLFPHNRMDELGVVGNIELTMRSSSGIFVHSENGLEEVVDTFRVDRDKCFLIPFGDHSIPLGEPLEKGDARRRLGFPEGDKMCLVFGTVSPYKGSDEIIRFWVRERPSVKLVVVGPILSELYARELYDIADNENCVALHLSKKWLSDEELRLWLSAADCALFNYRAIFSSGASALARSFGVPVIIPKRLVTVDLGEPHPSVIRFESPEKDLLEAVMQASEVGSDYDRAADWRNQTRWAEVARLTKEAYHKVLR